VPVVTGGAQPGRMGWGSSPVGLRLDGAISLSTG